MTANLRPVEPPPVPAMPPLVVPDPAHDACLMPTGWSRLCILPGVHTGSCIPAPESYPPLVVTAVTA